MVAFPHYTFAVPLLDALAPFFQTSSTTSRRCEWSWKKRWSRICLTARQEVWSVCLQCPLCVFKWTYSSRGEVIKKNKTTTISHWDFSKHHQQGQFHLFEGLLSFFFSTRLRTLLWLTRHILPRLPNLDHDTVFVTTLWYADNWDGSCD